MRVNTPIKQNLYKTMITAPACSRPRKYSLGLVGLFWVYILAVDTRNPGDNSKRLQDD